MNCPARPCGYTRVLVLGWRAGATILGCPRCRSAWSAPGSLARDPRTLEPVPPDPDAGGPRKRRGSPGRTFPGGSGGDSGTTGKGFNTMKSPL